MASLFASFSAAPVEVEIKLAGEDERKQVEVKGDKDQKVMCPVFYDGESVAGQVCGSVASQTCGWDKLDAMICWKGLKRCD
jgi:vacuolar protein sorting-associated protein 26